MVIYGEYLFLENFITGLVIIYFTLRIAGETAKWWRLLITGLLCGAYSFIIFADMGTAMGLCSKLLFSLIAVWVAFGRKPFKEIITGCGLFLIVTFIYGGIAIALLNAFSWRGITAGTGFYMPCVTYLSVFAAATAATLMLFLVVDIIKTKRNSMRNRVNVVVCLGERETELKGYIDSGNFLKEPISGKPVCIINKAVLNRLLEGICDVNARYTVIPYNAVGTRKGILDGYRTDAVKVQGRVFKKLVLAVCEDENFVAGGSDSEILLHSTMLERGIYGDFDGD